MKNHFTCLLLVTFALLPCFVATGQDNNATKASRPPSLPDNPCEILDPTQLSAITGLEITSARRVPSITKIVRAERENREPIAGTICSYETSSDFGAIAIVVPTRAERREAVYWERRAKYFKSFPGAAKFEAGLGKDAWSAGGNSLEVLVREDEHFSLSTQMYQPGSREMLVKIARKVLQQL